MPAGALSSVTAPGGAAQNYTADAFGELASAPGGIGYGYDALGRLVTRTAGPAATSMSYLGTGGTLASDGSYNYSYTPGGTLAASAVSGGTGYAVMSDVHGDLAASFSAASGTSALAGSAAYSPYGAVAGAGYQPGLGYQGNWTDPSTGQVDMNARWYDPSTGSFATNDTVAGSPLPATVDGNPYAYASGDPLTVTDPTGHWGWGDVTKAADYIGQSADEAYNSVVNTVLPDAFGAIEATGGWDILAALADVAAPVGAAAAVLWPTPINGNDTCPEGCYGSGGLGGGYLYPRWSPGRNPSGGSSPSGGASPVRLSFQTVRGASRRQSCQR